MYQKVIMVADYAAYYTGNFMESLAALEEALGERSVSVEYILPEGAPLERWGDFSKKHDIHTCVFEPQEIARIVSSMTGESSCIVHCHFVGPRIVAAIKKVMRGSNCPIVVHEHMRCDWDMKRPKGLLKKFFWQRVLSDCYVIAVSSAVEGDVRAILGGRRYSLVENAVSTERLDRLDANLSGSYDSLRDVVIFGTHFERKGVDIALKAVEECENNLRLVVLTHDENLAIQMLDACDANWRERCEVRHVVQNPADVYRACLCFASPSRSEAFGYAVAEAAYCGCQVVASDIPGQNDMKDIPGISWVPMEDVRALSSAFDKCAERARSESAELKGQGSTAREYVREHYGLSAWVDGVLKVYAGLES